MFSITTHPWWRRWFGNRSERSAADFLRGLGFQILEHNFSCDLGEIDIVALDGQCVVFVEVRSTEGTDAMAPALSVDAKKQERLTRMALYYLKARRLLEHSARFDVLTISWPADQPEPKIAHYPNAFEATGRFQMYS
ncbi:MAG: YraN family protein [Planctomycetes bacterium]|nr:YraN family protein [Planctomycetota bacterium]